MIQWICIDISVLRFNIQCYICVVCFWCMFLAQVLLSFTSNGFNVGTYMSLVLLGLVKTCLVLCILFWSLFFLCSWIVFVDLVAFAFSSFVLLEFWGFGVLFCILRHACDNFLFLYSVFSLKFVFVYLNQVQVLFLLCFSFWLSGMKFWILLIVLLASFNDFNISNNWTIFLVVRDSLSFESSPTLYITEL